MSDSPDSKETLLDLFSTRKGGEGASGARAEESGAVPQEGERQSARQQDPSAAGTKKGGLSPVANAVLRETRRELGTADEEDAGPRELSERQIANAVDKVCETRGYAIDDIVRAEIIVHLQQDLLGWGVLQPLVDNQEVTDIHVYDYQTVVLQRGKICETTGLSWPSHEAYCTFIDRVLFRLGKS